MLQMVVKALDDTGYLVPIVHSAVVVGSEVGISAASQDIVKACAVESKMMNTFLRLVFRV
jgi:hypothetical protein